MCVCERGNANFLCGPAITSCMEVVYACNVCSAFVCVLLCEGMVFGSIQTLPAQHSFILKDRKQTPLQRHAEYCYQGKIEFLTAAVISCFTLSKHSLHHICATMVLITFDKRGYISFLVPVLLTHSFYLECYYSRC